MKLSDFDYTLPPERIAQTPITPRDASRLFVYDRQTGLRQHTIFSQIGDFLSPGDLLVLNQTKVLPVRLFATKVTTGGSVELLLLNKRDDLTWETLVGGKRVTKGKQLELPEGIQADVIEELDGPRRLIKFSCPLEGVLEKIGQMPLPPYIHEPLQDPNRYQTIYAEQSGSAAAPTAGLHFTPGLLIRLQESGINLAEVTLHVGLDTFAPVTEENIEDHPIHTEWCHLPQAAAEKINQTRRCGGRVVAVGTTSVRTLESAARVAKTETISPFEGSTDLFIYPGYTFHTVDAIITNFHLPRSTLLMLISAFAGHQEILDLYQEAVEENYRFYSFGDAMLII
jgi:S-adenosylmethionine:tRNA ribosyltransferase-isomerase